MFAWKACTISRASHSVPEPFLRTYNKLKLLTFGTTISGIVWVDKHYLWLVNGCLEYHQPIITNTCPPKQTQKSMRPRLVLILLGGRGQLQGRHLILSFLAHTLKIDTLESIVPLFFTKKVSSFLSVEGGKALSWSLKIPNINFDNLFSPLWHTGDDVRQKTFHHQHFLSYITVNTMIRMFMMI